MSDLYDTNFIRQMQQAAKRTADQSGAVVIASAEALQADPTREIRRKQANLCEAVMQRVMEMEAAGNAMLEAAKKLRAAVVANT